MITPTERKLLRVFGSMTTPSMGGYHTLDMERWGDFVVCVYKNTKRQKPVAPPTPDELMSVLGKFHFGQDHVQWLYDALIDDLAVVSRCL